MSQEEDEIATQPMDESSDQDDLPEFACPDCGAPLDEQMHAWVADLHPLDQANALSSVIQMTTSSLLDLPLHALAPEEWINLADTLLAAADDLAELTRPLRSYPALMEQWESSSINGENLEDAK